MSLNLFRFNSSLKKCKNTHRETHTHTQCRHSYPYPSTDAYIKQESRVMCTNYTYSIKPAAKKKNPETAVERIPERTDKTRTWWKANHPDLSQQRDTFRKPTMCIIFTPHKEKKSTISCLNMKVVWVAADQTWSLYKQQCLCKLQVPVLPFWLPLCGRTNKILSLAPTEGTKKQPLTVTTVQSGLHQPQPAGSVFNTSYRTELQFLSILLRRIYRTKIS